MQRGKVQILPLNSVIEQSLHALYTHFTVLFYGFPVVQQIIIIIIYYELICQRNLFVFFVFCFKFFINHLLSIDVFKKKKIRVVRLKRMVSTPVRSRLFLVPPAVTRFFFTLLFYLQITCGHNNMKNRFGVER